MINSIFGEMTFNTGWKTSINVVLFGKSINVIVKAKAYFEEDGITDKQENAFNDFIHMKEIRLKKIEELLDNYVGNNVKSRFSPQTLLFERDGAYALLFDDNQDVEGGIAVCLFPNEIVRTQGEYL